MAVHPQAVVGADVKLANNVEVGPFAVIDGHVEIGAGTHVYPHTYITGWTSIGEDCQIHPGAVIGSSPQDLHYGSVRSFCRIGTSTIMREGVSIHRGTEQDSVTSIGDACFLMANSHVGHNCVLGNNVILTNAALLAGRVSVGEGAVVGGGAAIHQFVRVGRRAMIGGLTRVTQDVPPFLLLMPPRGLVGVNRVGAQRAGIDAGAIRELGQLYKQLFRQGLPLAKAVEQARASVRTAEGREFLDFCVAESTRGVASGMQPKRA